MANALEMSGPAVTDPFGGVVEVKDDTDEKGYSADENAAYMMQLKELMGSANSDSQPPNESQLSLDVENTERGERALDASAFEIFNKLPRRYISPLADALGLISRYEITFGTIENFIATHAIDSLKHIWELLFHQVVSFKHLFLVEPSAPKRLFSEAMIGACDCIFKDGASLVKPIVHNEKDGLKTPVPWASLLIATFPGVTKKGPNSKFKEIMEFIALSLPPMVCIESMRELTGVDDPGLLADSMLVFQIFRSAGYIATYTVSKAEALGSPATCWHAIYLAIRCPKALAGDMHPVHMQIRKTMSDLSTALKLATIKFADFLFDVRPVDDADETEDAKRRKIVGTYKDDHHEIFCHASLKWPPCLKLLASDPALDFASMTDREQEKTFYVHQQYLIPETPLGVSTVQFIDVSPTLKKIIGWTNASNKPQVKSPWKPLCPRITDKSIIVVRVLTKKHQVASYHGRTPHYPPPHTSTKYEK
jgi:hypothetical protein